MGPVKVGDVSLGYGVKAEAHGIQPAKSIPQAWLHTGQIDI
jgi:hypothetical protein